MKKAYHQMTTNQQPIGRAVAPKRVSAMLGILTLIATAMPFSSIADLAFPVRIKFSSPTITWTNIDEVTINRIFITTAVSCPNTSTIWVVKNDQTNAVLSQYQASHQLSYWDAQDSHLRVLNPGDRIIAGRSTTNATYLSIDGTVGQQIGSDTGGGGSGSGFPLTANADAGGYSVTNFATLHAVLGLYNSIIVELLSAQYVTTNLDFLWNSLLNVGSIAGSNATFKSIGSDSIPYAYLMNNGSGYTHQYGARLTTNLSDIANAQAVSNFPTVYPGQIAYNNTGAEIGNSFMLIATLVPTNYQPYTATPFPFPGSSGDSTNFWRKIASSGGTGATGSSGVDGADGVANLLYDVWSGSKTYSNTVSASVTSLVVVSYGGQWWDLTNSPSVGNIPGYSTPNDWAVSVSKGADGTLIGTNLMYMGEWSSSFTNYFSNSVVRYFGNLYYKGSNATVNGGFSAPATTGGTAYVATDNAYWDWLLQRGVQGSTGLAGAPGAATYTFYNYYTNTFIGTNMIVGVGDLSNRMLAVTGQTGGTNNYGWVNVLYVGTNIVSTDGTNMLWNGALIAADVPAGITNLYDLNLVDAIDPQIDEALVWNGSVWTNAPVSGVITGATSGSGNVVTQVLVSAGIVTEQRGTVSGGSVTIAYTPTNYTPVDATQEGHLVGVDTALGSSGGGGDGLNFLESYSITGGESSISFTFDPMQYLFIQVRGWVLDGGSGGVEAYFLLNNDLGTNAYYEYSINAADPRSSKYSGGSASRNGWFANYHFHELPKAGVASAGYQYGLGANIKINTYPQGIAHITTDASSYNNYYNSDLKWWSEGTYATFNGTLTTILFYAQGSVTASSSNQYPDAKIELWGIAK